MKSIRILGASYALLSVALGAFGAHALKEPLESNKMLSVWKTAVDYQMWHALAILAVSTTVSPGRFTKVSLVCFGLGIFLFSGSLYIIALGGPRWLGPITPIGGSLFLVGWAFLIASVARNDDST